MNNFNISIASVIPSDCFLCNICWPNYPEAVCKPEAIEVADTKRFWGYTPLDLATNFDYLDVK